MAGVSFLAVYREMFETVLFYQALWAQAGETGRGALAGGLARGADHGADRGPAVPVGAGNAHGRDQSRLSTTDIPGRVTDRAE